MLNWSLGGISQIISHNTTAFPLTQTAAICFVFAKFYLILSKHHNTYQTVRAIILSYSITAE